MAVSTYLTHLDPIIHCNTMVFYLTEPHLPKLQTSSMPEISYNPSMMAGFHFGQSPCRQRRIVTEKGLYVIFFILAIASAALIIVFGSQTLCRSYYKTEFRYKRYEYQKRYVPFAHQYWRHGTPVIQAASQLSGNPTSSDLAPTSIRSHNLCMLLHQ